MAAGAAELEQVFRRESGRILGVLCHHLRDLDLAEEALQEAMAAALEDWPRHGLPEQPAAWLITVARRRALDRLRRRKVRDEKAPLLAELALPPPATPDEPSRIDDEELRLLFLCCHPALDVEAQVALTLRTLGGLRTEEIAAAFLVPAPTMGQRLSRAKRKIQAAGMAFALPPDDQLDERLAAVCAVVYLVFNEGYAASSGDQPIRAGLCGEAIHLGRRLARTFPADAEIVGLLALMLLHDARRPARLDAAGRLVLLEEQDRRLWHRPQIAEGLTLIQRALRWRRAGPYQVQAAIAAVHAEAATPEATDWRQIVALYDVLLRWQDSPVLHLNQAAAWAMVAGPERGLKAMADLDEALAGYHLLPAARAELLRRLGRWSEASACYDQALALVGNDGERELLERRRGSLPARGVQ